MNNEENWIYTKDKLPSPNEKILLYIVNSANVGFSEFGVFNGKFYETSNSDYSKDDVIAWQVIEQPKNINKVVNEMNYLENKAEKWARERVDYELEYANAIKEPFTKEMLLDWTKLHIYNTAKNGFINGYEYAKINLGK